MRKNIISGRPGALALTLVVLSLIGFILPSTIASAKPAPPPSGPKIYSVAVDVQPAAGDALTFTITITNLPQSSAVIGSANVTIPAGFTGVSAPAIVGTSNNKVWSAAKQGSTIKLRAVGDMQKLSPGQFVSVRFTATPPSATSSSQSFVFVTAAKASRDFSGSSNFTRAGSDPRIVVCPDSSDPCTADLGSQSNAPADHQTGSVTLDDGCYGCILTITETAGNFCSTGVLPANCQTPFVIRFSFTPAYDGIVTVKVVCDASDCPVIEDPCSEGCSDGCGDFCTALSEFDFYPVYFTDSDTNDEFTEVTEITDECSPGFYPVGPPCIDSQGRLSSGDYFSIIKLGFSSGSDPRTGH